MTNKFSPGCTCCGSTPCACCTNTPDQMQVVIGGLGNLNCSDCASYNGTYLCDKNEDDGYCTWTYSGTNPGSCSGTVLVVDVTILCDVLLEEYYIDVHIYTMTAGLVDQEIGKFYGTYPYQYHSLPDCTTFSNKNVPALPQNTSAACDWNTNGTCAVTSV